MISSWSLILQLPLLYVCPLIFGLTYFGWLCSLTYSIISYGNILFNLDLFDLNPPFQEHKLGIKEGFGVLPCLR